MEVVRKQYYFRPRGEAFDAWDIDRLLELSADLPVARHGRRHGSIALPTASGRRRVPRGLDHQRPVAQARVTQRCHRQAQ